MNEKCVGSQKTQICKFRNNKSQFLEKTEIGYL